MLPVAVMAGFTAIGSSKLMALLCMSAVLVAIWLTWFTTRKMAQQDETTQALQTALKEASAFRALFESSPGLYLILLPDLTITAVSEEYLQATMTQRNQIMGRKLFDVFPDNPDDTTADGVSNLRASLNTVLNTKAAHTMAVQKYDIRRPDGVFEVRYWSPLNKPVLGDNGDVVYLIHSVVDVTRRVRAENENERAAEEIKDLYDRAPCGYLSVDANIFICNINQTLLSWLGYEAEEVIGQMKYEDLLTPESRDAHLSTFNEVFADYVRNGFVNDLEYVFQRKNGTSFPALVNSVAVLDGDGNFVKSRSTVFDNTERKKAEEKLKMVNKELEAFTYSVSHDLRAPLRAIHGYSQILKEDFGAQLGPEATRVMNNIMNNARKMGLLIDDLLTFSRLGRKDLQKKNIIVQDMVTHICGELKSEQNGRDIDFYLQPLPPVEADEVAIHQVWVNLISNAVKYSKRKEKAVIEIGFETKNDEIIYYIRDNGAGFDMRYADKLFGVFQRLHSDEEFEGTGVGLAIVQRIIIKHGGNVWAEGKVDEGATFYFSLSNKTVL